MRWDAPESPMESQGEIGALRSQVKRLETALESIRKRIGLIEKQATPE